MWSSGLVIGARHSTTAEWLLAHHGSSGLVVDVEVSGGHFELLQSALDEFPERKCYKIKVISFGDSASLPSIIVSATWGLAFLKFQNVHFAKTIQIKIVNF